MSLFSFDKNNQRLAQDHNPAAHNDHRIESAKATAPALFQEAE